MCFDAAGNLYTTNFFAFSVSKFSNMQPGRCPRSGRCARFGRALPAAAMARDPMLRTTENGLDVA